MKKSILVAAIAIGSLLFCATMATAQATTKKGERRGMSQQQLDRMSEELKLTEDQKTKVKAAFDEQWACTEIACKDKALQRLKCYVCKERKRLEIRIR